MPGDDAFAGERGQLVEALAAARRGEKEAFERAQHDRQQLDALQRSHNLLLKKSGGAEAPAAVAAWTSLAVGATGAYKIS